VLEAPPVSAVPLEIGVTDTDGGIEPNEDTSAVSTLGGTLWDCAWIAGLDELTRNKPGLALTGVIEGLGIELPGGRPILLNDGRVTVGVEVEV
jgi:hypothetical protein